MRQTSTTPYAGDNSLYLLGFLGFSFRQCTPQRPHLLPAIDLGLALAAISGLISIVG
jgi:hypothetical protein